MAFTLDGATSGAALIKEKFGPGFVQGVYLNNQLFQHFPDFKPLGGGQYYNWIVHSAGNTNVEVFSSGQAQKAAVAQSWVQLKVAPTYIRAIVQIDGIAKDAMASAYVDGLIEEMSMSMEDIRDLLTTSFMGGTYGLQLAIDDAATYAGQARGSASWFESYVKDLSTASLAYSDLVDTYEAVRDNDHGGNPALILTSWNQQTNIFNLSGNQAMKITGPEDLAKGFTGQTFNGAPIVALGDMDDNDIFFIDSPKSEAHWVARISRPMGVKVMAPSGDSDVYQVSTGALLANRNPARDGKIENAAA